MPLSPASAADGTAHHELSKHKNATCHDAAAAAATTVTALSPSCSPQIAGRYFGKKNPEGGGGGEEDRDGEIAAVRAAYQEEVNRGGGGGGGASMAEEKAFNKLAEKLTKLSKEIESLKELAPEESLEWVEGNASRIKSLKTKNSKSKQKKSRGWVEPDSGVKGDSKDGKAAELKASKAENKNKNKNEKSKGGKSKEKKLATWGEGASAPGAQSEGDERKVKSKKVKAAKKKAEANGVEREDALFQEHQLPHTARKMEKIKETKKVQEGGKKAKKIVINNGVESEEWRVEDYLDPRNDIKTDTENEKSKKSKKIKKDKKHKKDKKDKDSFVKSKEEKQKKAKGSQRSAPVPVGVYGAP